MTSTVTQQLKKAIQVLDGAYTADNLKSSWVKFSRHFIKHQEIFCIEKGIPIAWFDGITKSVSKGNLLKIAAIPFANEEIFQCFFKEYFPKTLQQPLIKTVWGDALSGKELEEKYNIQVFQERAYHYGYNKELSPEVNVFDYSRDWRSLETKYSFSLNEQFAAFIKPFFPKPADFHLVPIPTLAPELKQFSAEQSIFQDLPKVISAILSKLVKYGKNGKVLASSIKNLQKTLKLSEFYPEEKTNKELFPLRSQLLIGLLEHLNKQHKADDTLTYLKEALSRFSVRYNGNEVFLSHLKGYSRIQREHRGVYPQEKALANSIKLLPDNKWISINNFERHLFYQDKAPKPVDKRLASDHLYYNIKYDGGYTEREYISMDAYHDWISLPMLKGVCFLFASLGFLDIAYQKVDTEAQGETYYSPFDGITHIRLNKLGSYILGLRSNYTPPKVEQGAKISLSSDDLMILLDKEDPISAALIEQYTYPVMPTRFKLADQTLLKNCASKKELEVRIQGFCQTVGVRKIDLPQNWKDYFDSLLNKVVSLKTVSNVKVIQLPNNRELLRIIAKDTKLKAIVTKAEGLQIIIKQDKWTIFKNTLKKYGYIIE